MFGTTKQRTALLYLSNPNWEAPTKRHKKRLPGRVILLFQATRSASCPDNFVCWSLHSFKTAVLPEMMVSHSRFQIRELVNPSLVLSIRSHAKEVETLTLSERHFRLRTCGKDTLLIFAVSSYLQYLSIFINIFNIIQYHTMCSKQGKPSVPVLTLMPSSSVGRNSDPFLGLPVPLLVLLEHPTSAWHKCQPKKLPPKNCFERQ